MKRLLFLILILITIIPLPSQAQSPVKVRIAALTGNVGLAMVKSIDQSSAEPDSPFAYEVYKSPDPVLGKLITGEIDLAGLPTNIAANLYNKGAGVQIAAIIGWGVMYVVSSDPGIKKWPDLKGREICVASKGAVSDILFQYLVTKNGLDPEKDMKIQYLANAAEVAQLLVAEKFTCAAIPEPWVTVALDKNPGLKVVLDYQKEWQKIEKNGAAYPQTCVVVREKFAREHPQELRRFLSDLKSSISWIKRYPKSMGPLAEKYLQIPDAVAQKSLSRCNIRYSEAYRVRPEVDRFIQRLLEFAPESIGGKLPDAGFYYQP
ncbi:MAG TPA: PhnD/SsuA/transferrin family substrate-binding protein [Bacillota bacterium]|nr:PhnD/SsuA/transferrin family substrate-binding protein [Bacillota bacterium]